MSDLAIVLLAGGGSSRMGRAKQLLQIDGKPLLARAAQSAADSEFRPIFVVLGAEYEVLAPCVVDLPVTVIINPDWSRGIGTSIRAGVEAVLKHEPRVGHLMILLADQPRISANVIRRLWNEHEMFGKEITVSSFDNSIGPPVIANRSYFAQLLALPDDQGAKSLWKQNPQAVHRAQCPEAATDIDTPEDYGQYSGSGESDTV
jgi:molybdenum cofactor cytidylyltransferase